MNAAHDVGPSSVSMRDLVATMQSPPAADGDATAAWRAAAQAAIRAPSLDSLTRTLAPGVERLPLYDQIQPVALPRQAAAARALRGDWDIRALIDADQQAGLTRTADVTREALRVAREAGATSASWTPFGDDALTTLVEALVEADEVDFPVYIEVGPRASRWLQARVGGGVGKRGGVVAAPLAALARDGALPCSLDDCWDDLAACLRDPAGRDFDLVSFSALPAHEAGASVTLSLAFAFAQLAETARAMQARGLAAEAWIGRSWLQLGIDGDAMINTAMVRAARACALRMQVALGVDPNAQGPKISCLTTRTGLSALDPWTNLLRASAEGIAAAVGGADAITCTPWDAALGVSDASAQRLALTSQAVLAREGHLGAVADPTAGAYAIESWTDQIAQSAWSRWQAIEAQGGLASVLRSGTLQAEIKAERDETQRAVDSGGKRMVGANTSPARGAQLPSRPDRFARGSADQSAPLRCDALPRIRWTMALEQTAAQSANAGAAAKATEADDER